MKARAVESEETRRHLHDAHNRVISVAAVQKHLHGSVTNGSIEMGPYLATLCAALAQSMIGDNQTISIKFSGRSLVLTSTTWSRREPMPHPYEDPALWRRRRQRHFRWDLRLQMLCYRFRLAEQSRAAPSADRKRVSQYQPKQTRTRLPGTSTAFTVVPPIVDYP